MKRGFSLIEVLVSVAVIALLIGLVVPTLRESWLTAKRLKCRSNLRQIHTAFYGQLAEGLRIQWTPELRCAVSAKPFEYRLGTAAGESWVMDQLPCGLNELIDRPELELAKCSEAKVFVGGKIE